MPLKVKNARGLSETTWAQEKENILALRSNAKATKPRTLNCVNNREPPAPSQFSSHAPKTQEIASPPTSPLVKGAQISHYLFFPSLFSWGQVKRLEVKNTNYRLCHLIWLRLEIRVIIPSCCHRKLWIRVTSTWLPIVFDWRRQDGGNRETGAQGWRCGWLTFILF